ncbi:MAG: hypothetical protein O3B47_03680 [bacterium]|nr:hypothetical protein [bacterium]
MKKLKLWISVNNKNHPFTIQQASPKNEVLFECPIANISQGFLKEDIAELLMDLPELILDEIAYKKAQKDVVRFRLSAEEKKKIQRYAFKSGFNSISSYLRAIALKKV